MDVMPLPNAEPIHGAVGGDRRRDAERLEAMKADRLDGAHRKSRLVGRVDGELRQLRAHRGLPADAATLAADSDQTARRGCVQPREVIGVDRDPTAPAMSESDPPPEKREQVVDVAN